MKRLILDHYRRWAPVMIVIGVCEFFLGGQLGTSADKQGLSVGFQFQAALFSGAFLLSFDLQRGLARAMAVLPLSARQIGRAWWWATVAIPAAGLSVVVFLGAFVFHLARPYTSLQLGRLTETSVFSFLWLGAFFTLTLGINPSLVGNKWARLRGNLLGVVFGLIVGGGFWFFTEAINNPLKLAVFSAVGAVLTVIGWLRAEEMASERAGFRLSALESLNAPGRFATPVGYGGIPWLIKTVCERTFLAGLVFTASVPLLWSLQEHHVSWRQGIRFLGVTGTYLWMIAALQLMPVLLHLRLLRTLPITAPRLALLLVILAFFPLLAVGVVMAGLIGVAVDSATALSTFYNISVCLAPASLCLFVTVWRGLKTGYVCLLFCMVGAPFLLMVFRDSPIASGFIPLGVLLCAAVSWWLLTWALSKSSLPYRVQASLFGVSAWGVRR